MSVYVCVLFLACYCYYKVNGFAIVIRKCVCAELVGVRFWELKARDLVCVNPSLSC